MPYQPFESVPVGGTRIRITRLGFGTAAIAGLYHAVDHDDAIAMCQYVWDAGTRYFDTAPQYGYGLAERRLGEMLRDKPRDSYVVSTKVGRLIRPASAAELARPSSFQGTTDERPVWDFTRDGVRRSLDESLARLGLDRVDIVFLHDPDDHWQLAIDEAYPCLHELRAQGVVGAIGAGMNQAGMLARFAREAEMDVFLCAGRYTLMDQSALPELLPLCTERGITLVIGGVMNSGILANPVPGARFDYATAPDDLVARAQAIREVCERHGVSIREAAMQLPLAHPQANCILAGVRTPAHFDDYVTGMREQLPEALWADLRSEGLIAPDAPVPGRSAQGTHDA